MTVVSFNNVGFQRGISSSKALVFGKGIILLLEILKNLLNLVKPC